MYERCGGSGPCHGRRSPEVSEQDRERSRWEQLRRAMLQVVAQFQEPEGRYTLDIRIVSKEPAQKIA